MKALAFIGSAQDDLRAFPATAREEAGYQLYLVQTEEEPDDWKPFPDVGSGVNEIRVRDPSGIYRVMYVAKFSDAVYVLHCFQKKTQKTSASDVELAKKRYSSLLRSLRP
jgi:phage-related protein